MTQPKLARARSGREYVWPANPPHELAVPSVTTIIGGGVPKPVLVDWAAKQAAEYAVTQRDAWAALPPRDAVDLISRASTRYTNHKAGIGDAVHNAIEAYLGGEVVRPLDETERMYARGAFRFLRDYQVKVAAAEATVFSRRHGYAGTFDLFYETPALPGLIVGDWKTSKSVYNETALQLAAIAHADFIADDDGVTERPMPEDIQWGTTIRLTPEGHYEAVLFRLSNEVFRIFLAAKVVAEREAVIQMAREDYIPKPKGDP